MTTFQTSMYNHLEQQSRLAASLLEVVCINYLRGQHTVGAQSDGLAQLKHCLVTFGGGMAHFGWYRLLSDAVLIHSSFDIDGPSDCVHDWGGLRERLGAFTSLCLRKDAVVRAPTLCLGCVNNEFVEFMPALVRQLSQELSLVENAEKCGDDISRAILPSFHLLDSELVLIERMQTFLGDPRSNSAENCMAVCNAAAKLPDLGAVPENHEVFQALAKDLGNNRTFAMSDNVKEQASRLRSILYCRIRRCLNFLQGLFNRSFGLIEMPYSRFFADSCPSRIDDDRVSEARVIDKSVEVDKLRNQKANTVYQEQNSPNFIVCQSGGSAKESISEGKDENIITINDSSDASTSPAPTKSDSSGEDNKILMVFPFEAEEETFEDASKNLQELGGMVPVVSEDGLLWKRPAPRKFNDKHSSLVSRSVAVPEDDGEEDFLIPSTRTHFMTIRQDEMERLEQGEFLNDTLVDFFMRWIWRNDDPETSAVHYFTSHFFTTLDEEGPEAVSSWTAKKNIDIFKKRFVFIPINESLHWSLCVVVSPGVISNEYVDEDDQSDDQEFPCILFLDSLKAHRKARVANKVRNWLNHEAKRLGKFTELFEGRNPKVFNKDTMEVIDPKVPYQDNSWDCGVFVCRYAYALYLMRNRRITYGSAGLETRPYFRNLITDSPEFNFNMSDIGRVRDELKQLITNLSPKYFEAKDKEKLEQDEKRKAKKRKIGPNP